MKKIKLNKILMLSFGALAIGGAIASVAVACRPNSGNTGGNSKGGHKNDTGESSGQGNKGDSKKQNDEVIVEKHFEPGSGSTFFPGYKTSDLPKEVEENGLPTRRELNEREKALLDLTTKQWHETIPEYTETLLSKGRAKDFYRQVTDPNGHNKFATTKDSGSIDQMDIAYAFGIAPHYAAIKHTYQSNGQKKVEYVPVYLHDWKAVADESKTWVGNIKNDKTSQTDITTNKIGTILTTTTRLGGYYESFTKQDPKVFGWVAQSRSTDILSKRPARLLPNWLFWADQNDPTQKYKVGNPHLKSKSIELAGNPNWYLDRYEPLINAGQMLDQLYDASKFDNIKNAEVGGQKGFTTFEAFARANVDIARKNISKWAKENASKVQGKTLLVVNNGNKSVFPNEIKTQDQKDFIAKNFYAYIPTLFPIMYASSDDPYTPGLGYQFPLPKKNLTLIQQYVDDFGWFGGRALLKGSGEAQLTVGKNIADAFESGVDVVTFVYDPSKVEGFDGSKASLLNFEKTITDFINSIGDKKNDYNLTKMLKENPKVGKNFFISSKDEFYDAGLAFVGTTSSVVNIANKIVNQNLDAPKVETGAYFFNMKDRGSKHIEGKHARDDASYEALKNSKSKK
ncbi:Vmc-like lipoprotein signal peptide domain-containing protein [Ureaplasma canigenitalium]|uniref:Vmc-like lipoprotein signal peptide domain-containing protein n=1 Tax=Ureaplasma canigenitalium TaxID=42092 RepID=UPI0004E0C174|nr:hypothetical protein [Ureaplasma canigenitalium]